MKLITAFFLFFLSVSFNLVAQNLPLTFRTGPAQMKIEANGTALTLKAGPNGSRIAQLKPGTYQFTFSHPGYISQSLSYTLQTKDQVIEQKLELEDSPLEFIRYINTQKRPKSVEFTPDGRYVVTAPLSGRNPQVFRVSDWSLVAELQTPEQYAKQQGFVEFAFLPELDEFWVSQMYTNALHIFKLSDFSYKETLDSSGQFPKVICVHPDGRVFVSNWVSQTIAVIDSKTRKTLKKIPVKGTPRGMAVSPDGKTIFIANFDHGTLDVLDTTSYTITKRLFEKGGKLPSGGAKRHIITDTVKNRLYMTDMARGSIFALDLADFSLVAEVKIGQKANTTKLSPDGKWLYACTRGTNNRVDYEIKGPDFGTLVMIDTDTMTIHSTQFGGNQPTGLALSKDGKTVIFSDFLDHRLQVYRVKLEPESPYHFPTFESLSP